MTEIKPVTNLIDRLRKRAEEDQTCADNSKAVFEGLSDQLRLFEEKDGKHNVYAVRIALDHRNGMERDAKYASDLREAIAELERLIDSSKLVQPSALQALQAIANLPTPDTESEFAGMEAAYRAVEALFPEPPMIEVQTTEVQA